MWCASGRCVAIRLSCVGTPCECSRCAAPRKLKPKSYTNSCTKNVSRFSFNLAPRIVYFVTLGCERTALRCSSDARQQSALPATRAVVITRFGAEHVHDSCTESVHRFSFNLTPRIVYFVTLDCERSALRCSLDARQQSALSAKRAVVIPSSEPENVRDSCT